MKTSVAFIVMLAALAAQAERQQFERYQSIIDRQMFGPLPPGFDPTKSPADVQRNSSASASAKELTKEQEKVKSAIRFSMINKTPEGVTEIGFTDNSDPKVPVHYYMRVGEKRNGWEVKEADADAATMTIVKDGIEVSLSLGGDSSGQGGKGGTASPASSPALGAGAKRTPTLLGGGSLRGRRMMRQQQEAADRAAADEQARQRAEERAAQKAEEDARREEQRAEREEQRKQLLQIQEELRKAREERQSRQKEQQSEGTAESNE